MRIWSLALLLACAEDARQETDGSQATEFVIPTCDKYDEQPGIRGFCLTIWAPTIEDPAQMEASCRQAGIWEGECRAAWLMVGMDTEWGRSRTIDELLDLCNGDALCAVAVLKMRSEQSLERQLEHWKMGAEHLVSRNKMMKANAKLHEQMEC